MTMQPEARPGGGESGRASSVGVIAQLLSIGGCGVDLTMADQYLETLQADNRMHVRLKSVDLIGGDIGPWR